MSKKYCGSYTLKKIQISRFWEFLWFFAFDDWEEQFISHSFLHSMVRLWFEHELIKSHPGLGFIIIFLQLFAHTQKMWSSPFRSDQLLLVLSFDDFSEFVHHLCCRPWISVETGKIWSSPLRSDHDDWWDLNIELWWSLWAWRTSRPSCAPSGCSARAPPARQQSGCYAHSLSIISLVVITSGIIIVIVYIIICWLL